MKNRLVKCQTLGRASVAKKTKNATCCKHVMMVVFVLKYWQLIIVFLIICTINRTVAIALMMIVIMVIVVVIIILEMKNIDRMLESAMSVRVDGGMRSDLAQHQHEKRPGTRSPCVVPYFAIARV